ncbi:MAG: gamma-glutamylcyclotransferase [Promethearchaeota archaeon]|nr:MAG: gamma-glutamylcyclotransferase [Candidatus Lokiarchaeota archaeon]
MKTLIFNNLIEKSKLNSKNSSNNNKRHDQKLNNLFVYGTLQHGKSRNYILKDLSYEKTILPDYKKVEPQTLGFPFIIQEEGSIVEGEVYFKVPDSLLERIDAIENEGVLYHRLLVKVKTIKEKEVEAFVYYPSEDLIKSYLEVSE